MLPDDHWSQWYSCDHGANGVSEQAKYKVAFIVGFSVATIAIFALSTLTPTSPYWQEAIIMFFAGAGLGAGMPILNLAVQNEFGQKDLGAATASVQLFSWAWLDGWYGDTRHATGQSESPRS